MFLGENSKILQYSKKFYKFIKVFIFRATRGLRESEESKGDEERREREESWAPRGWRASRGPKGSLDWRAPRGQWDPQGPRAPPATPGSWSTGATTWGAGRSGILILFIAILRENFDLK